MADLPAKPSLDHLRRQARDLLRAAQAGDPAAAGRIRTVSAGILAWPPSGTRTGWAPLHAARPASGTGSTRPGPGGCWPWPGAAGRGADPRPHRRGGRARRLDPAALRGRRCGHPLITRLLLERGAVPGTTICTWRGSLTTTTSACASSVPRRRCRPACPDGARRPDQPQRRRGSASAAGGRGRSQPLRRRRRPAVTGDLCRHPIRLLRRTNRPPPRLRR